MSYKIRYFGKSVNNVYGITYGITFINSYVYPKLQRSIIHFKYQCFITFLVVIGIVWTSLDKKSKKTG